MINRGRLHPKVAVWSILFLSMLNFSFLNCSKTEFSSVESSNKLGEPDGPKDPTAILKACETAKKNGTLIQKNIKVAFENSKQDSGRSQVCLFGQDGNLSKQNGFQRARYEQVRLVQIPTNAELCDLDFSMKAQSFTFDDMFFFTLNGRVLSSSNETSMESLVQEPLQLSSGQLLPTHLYSWNGVVNKPFNNEVTDNYCLGKKEGLSSCQWPKTQETGTFKLEYSPEILVHLGTKAADSSHELMFAVTGDNDESVDCSHSGFDLDINVAYYVK